MLPLTPLLYDWFWFFPTYILYIIFSRWKYCFFRDYNPFIRRSRIFRFNIYLRLDLLLSHRFILWVYKYFLVIYPLNSYVGSLISLGCTISVVISGCQFSFLFLLISFDLSGSVLLLNYLLTGLLIVIVNCCNYKSLINSACRPPLEIS